MRKLVGIDINGWHDFACRDWSVDNPDDSLDDLVVVDGGFGSVVVNHNRTSTGGPQAILSPIGRGGGWGDIGAADNRHDLIQNWQAFLTGQPTANFSKNICAAVEALSVQADGVVLLMPDRMEMSEARQQDLMTAASGRRVRVTLLWRSVAAALDLINSGQALEIADGCVIVCVLHGFDGFEIQRLTVRRLAEKPEYLAPERAEVGMVVCREFGLAALEAHARASVEAANEHLADWTTETPRLPFHLLFEEPVAVTEEIVRRSNGNWTAVRAPTNYSLPSIPIDLRSTVSSADVVVLLSPLAKRHRQQLADRLRTNLGGARLSVAHSSSAARGALIAGRRIERGIPHYLDRLDQVSLAVSRRTGPAFEDLIPHNATVPGNREYVSVPITSMTWPAGMKHAHFYIRKGDKEIRHWETPAIEAPAKSERLEVRLRQMPAQGWAKLSVTAPGWDLLRNAPIQLDWGSLQVDPRSEAEILAMLERPRPIVPERVRYRPHIGLWNGSLRFPGVSAALRGMNLRVPDTIKRLADTVSASYRLDGMTVVYPVGTDGDLPDELDEQTRSRFISIIERISEDLLRTIKRRYVVLENNHAIRCLTWTFALCPDAVKEELAQALLSVQASQDPPHPLLTARGSRTVVLQGLGRVATDAGMLRILIPRLYGDLARPNILAALSSVLSRPEVTPAVLTDEDAIQIAHRVIKILEDQRNQRKFGVAFKYALMVVAGLLRVRERDPWALLASEAADAQALVEVLQDIVSVIRGQPGAIPNEMQKLRIANELIALLSGNGGRPDILTMLDVLTETDSA